MKKIILAGASLNSGNRGVNALTRAQIMLILHKYGISTEIIILSYTVTEIVSNFIMYKDMQIEIKEIPCSIKQMLIGYAESYTLGSSRILTYISSSDAVWDISEGDSFSDIYGIKRFIQHSLIKLITIKMKTKLIIMPQTLGPFKRHWVQKLAKYILTKSSYVFVRDDISKKVVEEELGINRNIIYVPDMAFYMQPNSNVNIYKFVSNANKIKVGINVSALLYNGGYNGKNMFGLKVNYKSLIDNLIEVFARMNNIEVVLIPHVMTKYYEIEDDFRVCEMIAKEMELKVNIKINTIDKYYREDELKAIIGGCDFFVGSRMHACIGAISSLVPTSPIAYSRKFAGIWDKLGLRDCVTDPRNQTEEEIIQVVIDNFNNRDEIQDILNKKIPELKKEIEGIIDIIE